MAPPLFRNHNNTSANFAFPGCGASHEKSLAQLLWLFQKYHINNKFTLFSSNPLYLKKIEKKMTTNPTLECIQLA
jgi:hypothetical protein